MRLNPDRIYMEYILGYPAPTAVDTPAFTPMNHFTVRSAVEPGCYVGSLGSKTNVPAGACELADRVQDGDNNDAQLNALITGLRNLSSNPTGVQLFQNTPNPFNARTTIQFTIDHPCHVSLEIFNLLGQKVMTLVNEHQLPGKYTTQFDASAFPSSIYLYRMQAGPYQVVKKMELLK